MKENNDGRRDVLKYPRSHSCERNNNPCIQRQSKANHVIIIVQCLLSIVYQSNLIIFVTLLSGYHDYSTEAKYHAY